MASILPVGDRWRAQVRRAGRKSIAKTFDTKREAEAWARRVELELDGQQQAAATGDMTVLELTTAYRRLRDELGRPIDPTANTEYMLQHLEQDLGPERVRDLTPQRLANWAKARTQEGAGGYPVNKQKRKMKIKHKGTKPQNFNKKI